VGICKGLTHKHKKEYYIVELVAKPIIKILCGAFLIRKRPMVLRARSPKSTSAEVETPVPSKSAGKVNFSSLKDEKEENPRRVFSFLLY
jgi:hypothetical protein